MAERKTNMTNELMLTNIEDAVKVQAPVIIYDFESMKNALRARMANYDTVAFGDESSLQEQYKSMKTDRVELNKAVKAIGSLDTSIRKQVLAPFEEYKTKSSELKTIIEEVLNPLDEKVKDIESFWRDEKLKKIKEVYEQIAVGVEDDFKSELFNKIFNDSWTNQTTSLKKATAEMEELVNKYTSGITLIKSLNSDFEEEGINILKTTLDVTSAVTKMQELTAQKERANAALKARLEEEKQREIARAKAEAEAKAKAEAQAQLEKQLAAERARIEAESKAQAELEAEKAKKEAERIAAERQQFEAEKKAEAEKFAKEKNAFFANAINNSAATCEAANTVVAEGKTLIEVPTAALKMITRYLDSTKIEYIIK